MRFEVSWVPLLGVCLPTVAPPAKLVLFLTAMVREDTAEDAKLPPLPSTCETRRTPPRTKCSEQYWHTVVRTTDPTVSKFLPFLFQNAPGIVLQPQTLLASLLFTNDRQVSSLGQCSRCPGHPGTWHSSEREEASLNSGMD